jgi:hypothetical protein
MTFQPQVVNAWITGVHQYIKLVIDFFSFPFFINFTNIVLEWAFCFVDYFLLKVYFLFIVPFVLFNLYSFFYFEILLFFSQFFEIMMKT